MSNKNTYDLMYIILYTAKDGAGITRLRDINSFNSTHLDLLLDKLLEDSMLCYNEETKAYATTGNGRGFMDLYEQLMKRFLHGDDKIMVLQASCGYR